MLEDCKLTANRSWVRRVFVVMFSVFPMIGGSSRSTYISLALDGVQHIISGILSEAAIPCASSMVFRVGMYTVSDRRALHSIMRKNDRGCGRVSRFSGALCAGVGPFMMEWK